MSMSPFCPFCSLCLAYAHAYSMCSRISFVSVTPQNVSPRWTSQCCAGAHAAPGSRRKRAGTKLLSRMTARIQGKLLSERDVGSSSELPPTSSPSRCRCAGPSTGRQVPDASRGESRFHHELHHLLNLHCRPDGHRHRFELTACPSDLLRSFLLLLSLASHHALICPAVGGFSTSTVS